LGEQNQSERNIEALRPMYEAWARGDWTAGPDIYGPEMTWGWSDEFPEIHGTHSDPETATDRLRRWLSPSVMRDGKAESVMVFNDRDKALAAAGLPPR
jgi:ketosteroid isomerase-like protein